ncbi:MAG: asparagine synthetase B, partial [Alphaproteobacteria bacterium]
SRKRGFTVPVGEWIDAEGRRLAPLVARQPGIVEWCDVAKVETLFRQGAARHGFAAWSLLFFALWHQHHVVGLPIGGDVFDALAESG